MQRTPKPRPLGVLKTWRRALIPRPTVRFGHVSGSHEHVALHSKIVSRAKKRQPSRLYAAPPASEPVRRTGLPPEPSDAGR